MKKPHRNLNLTTVCYGIIVMKSAYGEEPLSVTDFTSVYQAFVREDEQSQGFIKFTKNGSKVHLQFSWAPMSLSGDNGTIDKKVWRMTIGGQKL